MVALKQDFPRVTQYIRKLRGGSQSILAQASDGLRYVVKFSNNLQGGSVLFNESAGSELYRACGLPTPAWKPLIVSDGFLDNNRFCWIETSEGRLRPASGLCFGSQFLGDCGRPIFEILPGTSLKRIRNRADFWLAWLIDVCADHVDNRQAIFVQADDGMLDAYFIDNGSLFGGPTSGAQRNFHASRYLDKRVYENISFKPLLEFKNTLRALDVNNLRCRMQKIPTEWIHASARESFERCLQTLTTPFFVQQMLDTITGSLEQRTENEASTADVERRSALDVLCIGLQGTKHRRVCARYPNCA